MKVRATRTGFYEHCRRREGDVFSLVPYDITVVDPATRKPVIDKATGKAKMRLLTTEEQFAVEWMEAVEEAVPERTTPAQAALSKANNELRDSRRPRNAREED